MFGRLGKSRQSRQERQIADQKKRDQEAQAQQIEMRGGQMPGLVTPDLGILLPSGGRISMQPRGASDAETYAPARDIFRLGPKLITAALKGFGEDETDVAKWPGWYGDWLRARGVTNTDIGNAAVALARAVGYFTADPAVMKTPEQALEKSEFYKCRPEAQAAIYMRLGEVVMGSIFVAIRDVTPRNGTPPNAMDIRELIVESNKLAEKLRRGHEH